MIMAQVELFAENESSAPICDCLHGIGAVSLTERRQHKPLMDALHKTPRSQDFVNTDEPPVQSHHA
jgi:hypothetical protein